MNDIREIITSTESLLWDATAVIPRVLLSLLILFCGWMFAKLMKRLIIRILRFIHTEEAAERVGIDEFLLQGGVRYTSVTLIAEIIYWFVIFSIMLLALNVIGMSEAGQMFTRIISHVPKLLIAMVALIFGTLLARFIQALMFVYLNNIGILGAFAISMIGQYAFLAFVVFVTLEQLGIAIDFLERVFEIVIAAAALSIGLAFGFGGRYFAKDLLSKTWKPNKDRK